LAAPASTLGGLPAVGAEAEGAIDAGARLRITDVETIEFSQKRLIHFPEKSKWITLRNSRGMFGGFRAALPPGRTSLTVIRTDQGVEGYAPGGKPETAKRLKPLLVGEDPLDRERLWHLIHAETPDDSRTHGAIDVALWDLFGRVVGMPVHKILGGGREKVPAYASTQSDVGTIEEWVGHALQCKERGYRGYKIHPYYCMNPETLEVHQDRRSYWKHDIELCEAIRDAVGADFKLMLDVHGVYDTVEQALEVGRALERLDYHWYEVPITESNVEGYLKLNRELDIPLVGPEWSKGAHYTRAEWIKKGVTDISRIDCHHRGITACIKAIHLAEAHGTTCEIHRGGWDHVQLVAGVTGKSSQFYERFAADPEVEESFEYWTVGNGTYEPMDADGMVTPPSKPGLGFEVNWDYIEENRI